MNKKIKLITATGKPVIEITVSPLAVLPMIVLHEDEGYMRIGNELYQRCVTWITDPECEYRHYSTDKGE